MEKIKGKVFDYLSKQPFEFVILVLVLGSIIWLIREGKDSLITPVVNFGIGSIVIIIVINLARWGAAKIDQTMEILPEIRDSLQKHNMEKLVTILPEIRDGVVNTAIGQDKLVESMKKQMDSFNVMAQSLSLVARRSILLLVEDSDFDQKLIKGLLKHIVHNYEIELEMVDSIGKAWTKIHRSLMLLLDVSLADSEVPEVQNFVEIVSSFCPIIIYSGGDYTKEDFPKAIAVLKKGSNVDKVLQSVESLLRIQLMK